MNLLGPYPEQKPRVPSVRGKAATALTYEGELGAGGDVKRYAVEHLHLRPRGVVELHEFGGH